MVFFSSRISPLTSTVIFLDRSPFATAVVTSAMLRTCAVKLRAMLLTLSVRSFHVPATPFTSAWPPRMPSVPTSRATRVTSAANDDSWSTIVLTVFFSSRISPFTSTVIFFDRSPLATAVVTAAMLRTWAVRFDALDLRLAAELALGADLAGHAGHFRGEGAELVHHAVDDLGRAQELALERAVVDLQGHRLRQVALADGADHPGRLADGVDEVAD